MAEAQVEAAPEPAKTKKKKGGLLLVGLIAALSLGGGGVAVALLLKSRGGEHGAAKSAEEAAAAEAHGEGGGEHGEAGSEVGVLSLEPFISNLADPEGDRYVKCTMRLVLDSRPAADKAKTDELSITRIRDRILTLLSSKTFADVATPEGKEALRAQIRDGVGQVLAVGKVSEVYYTEFIVQ
jgi:flagellar protein FliL